MSAVKISFYRRIIAVKRYRVRFGLQRSPEIRNEVVEIVNDFLLCFTPMRISEHHGPGTEERFDIAVGLAQTLPNICGDLRFVAEIRIRSFYFFLLICRP